MASELLHSAIRKVRLSVPISSNSVVEALWHHILTFTSRKRWLWYILWCRRSEKILPRVLDPPAVRGGQEWYSNLLSDNNRPTTPTHIYKMPICARIASENDWGVKLWHFPLACIEPAQFSKFRPRPGDVADIEDSTEKKPGLSCHSFSIGTYWSLCHDSPGFFLSGSRQWRIFWKRYFLKFLASLMLTWRWFVGLKISPTGNFMLCNLSLDILGYIKAIHRWIRHDIRWWGSKQ